MQGCHLYNSVYRDASHEWLGTGGACVQACVTSLLSSSEPNALVPLRNQLAPPRPACAAICCCGSFLQPAPHTKIAYRPPITHQHSVRHADHLLPTNTLSGMQTTDYPPTFSQACRSPINHRYSIQAQRPLITHRDSIGHTDHLSHTDTRSGTHATYYPSTLGQAHRLTITHQQSGMQTTYYTLTLIQACRPRITHRHSARPADYLLLTNSQALGPPFTHQHSIRTTDHLLHTNTQSGPQTTYYTPALSQTHRPPITH